MNHAHSTLPTNETAAEVEVEIQTINRRWVFVRRFLVITVAVAVAAVIWWAFTFYTHANRLFGSDFNSSAVYSSDNNDHFDSTSNRPTISERLDTLENVLKYTDNPDVKMLQSEFDQLQSDQQELTKQLNSTPDSKVAIAMMQENERNLQDDIDDLKKSIESTQQLVLGGFIVPVFGLVITYLVTYIKDRSPQKGQRRYFSLKHSKNKKE